LKSVSQPSDSETCERVPAFLETKGQEAGKKPALEKGFIQVYTGNGKGKTGAAFGLALRAIGRGLRVCVVQFIKGGFDYGESYVVGRLPLLEMAAYGRGKFITERPTAEDVAEAKRAFDHAKAAIQNGKFDIVILDEVNVAMHLGLLLVSDLVEVLKKRPSQVEVILTGRYAPEEIVNMADLVTEMREIKHPFAQGVKARKGIEY